ncbi:hypothetical protein COV16_03360, partial [Candidatus Woesearchaeota archaeon CG10_big_fil_rev_8_21_14_0_10_34_8]
MFLFTHTYILSEAYKIKGFKLEDVPSEVVFGNICPDFLADSSLRYEKNSKNYHVEIHDKIRGPGEIEFDVSDLLGLGFAIHVMADNYSQVGTYWRPPNVRTQGKLKIKEGLVELGDLEEKLGDRKGLFRRRLLQSCFDINVLRAEYDPVTQLIRKAHVYLGDNQTEVAEKVVNITGLPNEHIKERLERFLLRYGGDRLYYQALEQIRTCAAVSVIAGFGLPD